MGRPEGVDVSNLTAIYLCFLKWIHPSGLSVKVHAPTCFPTCAPTYAPTCTPTLMCRGGDYNAFHLSNLAHLRPLDPNTET